VKCSRAMVTGGAGFIGSHVVDALLDGGAEVVVYDNFQTGREEFLANACGERLSVVCGDTLDAAGLTAAMKGVDAVFHFQANADVRGGQTQPRVDLEQNIIATWNVLEAMRQAGVQQIVFASSATIYGEPLLFPTPEDYAPLQTSLYGASKLAGEAMIQAYCEYYAMRSFIYRFVSWIGERYTHGVVFDVMRKLRQDARRLPLLGDGTQRKSYLYVRDGVRGIFRGIENASANKNVFNLGHDYFLTVIDVVRIILETMGLKDVRLEFAGGRRGWLGDSPLVHLDTRKIKALGWAPETTIEEGLRRTVRYLIDHPHLLEARG